MLELESGTCVRSSERVYLKLAADKDCLREKSKQAYYV